MSISFTFTVVVPAHRDPYVFLKPFDGLDEAISWSRNEIETRDAEFILIREGENASDPVVWDSRVALRPIWGHKAVPASFPLREVNEYFEKRAASILGDYDEQVDFSVWLPEEKDGFRDYRYKNVSVRMAWMMYLDLAVQWHTTNQLQASMNVIKQIKQAQETACHS